MVFRVINFDRQECSGTDMQCNGFKRNSAIFQCPEKLRRKMQSGGRRGDSTFFFGEYSLVVFAVAGGQFIITFTLNIGWQRHPSVLLPRNSVVAISNTTRAS